MTAATVLRQAAATIADRQRTYGDAADLMDAVARRWSATLGRPVTSAEVVLCLIDLKLARLAHNPRHADSIVDVAGYAALLGEISR
jgi:hypothetical protein